MSNLICTTKASWKNSFLKDMQEYQQIHPVMVRSGIFLVGIYHTRKPNKIRVVFDCSVEYKEGVLK